jgi:hypothetical protein
MEQLSFQHHTDQALRDCLEQQNWTFLKASQKELTEQWEHEKESCLAFSQSKKRYPACSHIFFSLSQALSLLFLDYVVCLHFNRWIE